MSESPRHNRRELEPFTSPSVTTSPHFTMSAAEALARQTTNVFSFPLSNTAIFTPQQLIPSPGPAAAAAAAAAATAVLPPHFPFSFVTPSGQVLLSSPISPSLPLINSAIVQQPTLGARPMTSITAVPFVLPPALAPQTISSNLRSHSSANIQTSMQIKSPPVPKTQPTQVARESLPSSENSQFIAQHIPPTSSPPGTPISHQQQNPLQDTRPSYPATCTTMLQPRPKTQQGVWNIAVSHKQPETAATTSSQESLKTLLSSRDNKPPFTSSDLLSKQLEGERDLMTFYKSFLSSSQSKHLHIEVLPSQGNLKWLQVRQKVFHIDGELGPVVVARILVSSNGIVKLQLLFPVHKTIFTKLFVEEEIDQLLLELSSDHVICPGLPNYTDKFSVLGYHPSHVRIFESSSVKRYDHEQCPIWHIPTGTFSKRDPTAQKMCKQCKYLQNSVVRLANKACEVDPAERESWTNPSSNRPLAYMSAADREERYRKLRQERNQMLVKIRAYEERLGVVSVAGGSEGLSRAPAPEPMEIGGKVAEHLVSVTQLPHTEEGEEEEGEEVEGEEVSRKADRGEKEDNEERIESASSGSEMRDEDSSCDSGSSVRAGNPQETLFVKRKHRPMVDKKPIKRTKFDS